jgi:hypothetical protein
MTDLEELEDQIVDLQRHIDKSLSEKESLAQWEENLRKEQTRLNKAWADFDQRVQQTVDIRTIGLQHELNKAQYIASLHVKRQAQEVTLKKQLHNLFATVVFRLKKFV